MDWLKIIIDNLKELSKYAFPTFLVSVFLLFFNKKFESLHIITLYVNEYTNYIITVIIISLIISIYQLFNLCKMLYFILNRKKILSDLTKDEKEYLKRYFNEDKTSIDFIVTDGIAGGLVIKDILYKSTPNSGISHNLTDWARKILKNNPKYLS